MAESFTGWLKGMVRKFVTEDKATPFETFFTSALYFEPEKAQKLTYYYLGAAGIFNFVPGLGVATGKATPSDASELETALRKAGVGTFGKSGTSVSLNTRLGEYLGKYPSAAAAKTALTPAKRDALRMEATKLLSVPEDVWSKYFRSSYSAVGVRG